MTRQGKRVYGEPVVEKVDPRGKKYYWIGGYELGSLEIENSDITAVRDGYVSVTPDKPRPHELRIPREAEIRPARRTMIIPITPSGSVPR